MRDIRFRGKNRQTGEWEYGYFWKDDVNGDCFIRDGRELVNHRVFPDTVGELAYISEGGKEVYEGDYVQYKHDIFQVKGTYLVYYDKELQCFQGMPACNCPRVWDLGFPEPVGNKWDNSEEDMLIFNEFAQIKNGKAVDN